MTQNARRLEYGLGSAGDGVRDAHDSRRTRVRFGPGDKVRLFPAAVTRLAIATTRTRRIENCCESPI